MKLEEGTFGKVLAAASQEGGGFSRFFLWGWCVLRAPHSASAQVLPSLSRLRVEPHFPAVCCVLLFLFSKRRSFSSKGVPHLAFPSKEVSQVALALLFSMVPTARKESFRSDFPVCLPFLGCFKSCASCQLKELFVSRGISEPWKNEELITCCVCSCRPESLLISGDGSSALSPGH